MSLAAGIAAPVVVAVSAPTALAVRIEWPSPADLRGALEGVAARLIGQRKCQLVVGLGHVGLRDEKLPRIEAERRNSARSGPRVPAPFCRRTRLSAAWSRNRTAARARCTPAQSPDDAHERPSFVVHGNEVGEPPTPRSASRSVSSTSVSVCSGDCCRCNQEQSSRSRARPFPAARQSMNPNQNAPAEPINRAIAAYERAGFPVAYEPILLDQLCHASAHSAACMGAGRSSSPRAANALMRSPVAWMVSEGFTPPTVGNTEPSQTQRFGIFPGAAIGIDDACPRIIAHARRSIEVSCVVLLIPDSRAPTTSSA
jgi:hypothetical protein